MKWKQKKLCLLFLVNFYVVQKYNLKNEVTIPADFDKEPINQVCSFDLEGLVQNMNSYFAPIEEDDIFFLYGDCACSLYERDF